MPTKQHGVRFLWRRLTQLTTVFVTRPHRRRGHARCYLKQPVKQSKGMRALFVLTMTRGLDVQCDMVACVDLGTSSCTLPLVFPILRSFFVYLGLILV